MSEELAQLYRVQQLDSEIDRLRRALAVLDSGEELRAQTEALAADVATLQTEREAMESEQLDLELQMKTHEEKKKTEETRLYSGRVGNPKQLSDLQHEIEMLSREIDRLSDLILQLMDKLEAQAKTLAAKAARLTEDKKTLAEVEERFTTTSTRLNGEIEALETQRTETAAGIAPSLLRRYDQIRARGAGVGLVRVTAPACPGCHVNIPSDVIKQLKADGPPQSCESCGRLFYYEK